MKATIEPRPAECLPKLPALYLHKTTGSIYLIRSAPMPAAPSIIPTSRYTSILIFEEGRHGVRVGEVTPLHDLTGFEPFIGRLILENDK